MASDGARRRLWTSARRRAEATGCPFAIEPEDLLIPQFCPVLGIPLRVGKGSIKDSSPTVDKVVPHLGYVPGNVVVVSARANRLKSDASIEELMRIAHFYKQW